MKQRARAAVAPGRQRRRWRWLLSALPFAACEPLDIPLFPLAVDAGTQQPPDDAPAEPPPDAPGAAGAACLPGAVRCQDCVAAGACSAGLRCHPFTGLCVTPCGPGLPECPAAEVCNDELGGVCVSCVDDADCSDDGADDDDDDDSDDDVCDTLQGVCVECANDDHCTDDPLERPVCLAGLNVCGCETGDDCASGICELPDAKCEEEDEDDN